MTANRALMAGVTGQGSAQMTELPLEEGYAVTRIVRSSSRTSV
ncbi:hypothetical protein [Methylobacterium radiotolerans]|nr:hypothetical protein [Methylobacterium radiotolerans]